jgi:hypothetical protein
LSYRPHAQRNQYKDGKEISRHMRDLYQMGKLNELQSSFYNPRRPPEELYDLENDPLEINNLANDPEFRRQLKTMRSVLYQWMDDTHDPGLIPEPWLEELGKKYGNKYTAMKQPEYENINQRLIKIIEAGENKDITTLLDKIESSEPSERYWAVTWLGVNKAKSAQRQVEKLLNDAEPSVQIASSLALYKIDPDFNPIPALGKALEHPNLIVGMYAMNAIEQTGIRNEEVKSIAKKAIDSQYEFTMRFAKFLAQDDGVQ